MPQTTETGNILPEVQAERFFAVDIRSAVITAVLLRPDRPVAPGPRVG
jgi:hypothetical protein